MVDARSEIINDVRADADFKGISFSRFKKTEVNKELLRSLVQAKLEPACYWSAELVCAGHFVDLWETLLLFFGKYVHLNNLNIGVYLEHRLADFKTIVAESSVPGGHCDQGSLLPLRNCAAIRKLFCEIVCILCDAKRRHCAAAVKISAEDMNVLAIKDKFKAPTTGFGEEVFTTDDPKELFPFVNELAYSVRENNLLRACFWVEWLFEYELKCARLKEKLHCGRRAFVAVDPKFQRDMVWLVWDLCVQESRRRHKYVEKLMQSLLSLFCLKYSAGCHRKRKHLVYLAISVLCESFVFETELVRPSQLELFRAVKQKIHAVYAQIRKHEQTESGANAGADAGTGSGATERESGRGGPPMSANLAATIQKLEQLNSFGATFVPRL